MEICNFPTVLLLGFVRCVRLYCYLSVQVLPTKNDQVSQMLELLTRRDDALVKEFFAVLERSDQRHVVQIICDRHAASDDGVFEQPYTAQQRTDFRPHEHEDAVDAGQQVSSCDETEVKMVVENEVSAVHGGLPSSTGITTTFEAHLCLDVSDSNEPVAMDCASASVDDGNSLAPETTCKVFDTSPVPGLVSDAVNEVDSGQATRREPIQLREYQKELAKPGIEGHNLIICAPTGSGKTYTAGYICQQRRLQAQSEGRRFKVLFIVCTRHLITQQSDALGRIIGNDVRGADDKLALSLLSQNFDVVVATAQVLTIKFYC